MCASPPQSRLVYCYPVRLASPSPPLPRVELHFENDVACLRFRGEMVKVNRGHFSKLVSTGSGSGGSTECIDRYRSVSVNADTALMKPCCSVDVFTTFVTHSHYFCQFYFITSCKSFTIKALQGCKLFKPLKGLYHQQRERFTSTFLFLSVQELLYRYSCIDDPRFEKFLSRVWCLLKRYQVS